MNNIAQASELLVSLLKGQPWLTAVGIRCRNTGHSLIVYTGRELDTSEAAVVPSEINGFDVEIVYVGPVEPA